jgi:hypothetical protein
MNLIAVATEPINSGDKVCIEIDDRTGHTTVHKVLNLVIEPSPLCCVVESCHNYLDPNFGDGTCPSDHSGIRPTPLTVIDGGKDG